MASHVSNAAKRRSQRCQGARHTVICRDGRVIVVVVVTVSSRSKERAPRRISFYLGGDVTRGANNSSCLVARRTYRGRQTVHLTPRRGMPCPTQGAMPKEKNQKPPAPSPQSDRGPRGLQAENKPARTGRNGRDMQHSQKTGMRGAETVTGSQRARQGDTPRPRRPARAANGREKQGQRPPSRHERAGGEATSGGPFITTRSDTQHKNGWPGARHGGLAARGNPLGRERGKTSPEVRHDLRSIRDKTGTGESSACMCPTHCIYAGGRVPR